MEQGTYLPRVIDENVKRHLEVFGAVCIEGPKWCGKTWTSAFHSRSAVYIGDPKGSFQNRRLAELDPNLVLDGEAPHLIDEWQDVPSIWDAVRFRVDQTNETGRFILTGSSTPKRKGIMHSGVGRIAKLRMRPMSLFESGDSSGKVSLSALCAGNFSPVYTGDIEIQSIINLIVRGGWPGSLGFDIPKAKLLPEKYINTILEDDVNRLDDIKRDADKIRLLLRSLARNESTTASNRKLKNDIQTADNGDVDIEVIATYLDVLKRLFLTDNLAPFSPNVRSSVRIKQSEKRQLSDPSLACALLKLTEKSLLKNLEILGCLFESLCARDLKIYADSFDAKLYHYQDYKGREIDIVVELSNGHWCAFEVKLGASQIDQAASNLLKISRELKEESNNAPDVLCVLCGLSNAAYCREDGVFVVPITALRP